VSSGSIDQKGLQAIFNESDLNVFLGDFPTSGRSGGVFDIVSLVEYDHLVRKNELNKP